MTIHPPFGRPFRSPQYFPFAPSYTPLNHGSFGVHPTPVATQQSHLQSLSTARPDTFLVYDLPGLVDTSRAAIAPLLGAAMDEVVFLPNASTGINTVLRNLEWDAAGDGKDVIVYFSTIYAACAKTIASIQECGARVSGAEIELNYPVEDEDVVRLLREKIQEIKEKGKRPRLAMFDTVLTFPGARMPWEEMVKVCREMGVMSLIDGAHGIGHINLTHLGEVEPDFFVSNCHKWLYTPRGCAVFYVPFRNQHLIRTSLPTSHGYEYPSTRLTTDSRVDGRKSPFTHLFEFVATIDYTPYFCVPAALSFRSTICGGESAIRTYNFALARSGGAKVASILGTHTLDNKTRTLSECCFTNVALPIRVENEEEGGEISRWINKTAVKELDTYLQLAWHAGWVWVRLSAQIYLEMEDFEWVAVGLKGLCERIDRGEWREEKD